MLMDSVVPRVQTIFCHPMHSVIVPLFPRSFVTRGQALGFGKLAAMDVSGAQAIKLSGSFNHGFRFKRGRGAVEIDARIL